MAVEDFIDWALDPGRTDDEAYFAEKVVEFGLARWYYHIARRPVSSSYFLSLMDYKKERRRNPAHRVVLERTNVERAVDALCEVTFFLCLDSYDDRLIRDISGLRFFPHLRHVYLWQTEIADLTPLSTLPKLDLLEISDNIVEDYRPLSALAQLRFLKICCKQPWPMVDGLNALQSLEELRWEGNLLPLEGLGAFPHLRELHLTTPKNTAPLRDASRLPEMPNLKVLTVDSLNRLDGLQRYPNLCNLDLGGCFSDLSVLTQLPSLTHVSLNSTAPLHLEPLVHLPELRKVKLKTEYPCDLYVLTDVPELRELVVEGCEANVRELPTLRSVLSSWDEDFLVPQPRALAPMRYAVQNLDCYKDYLCETPTDLVDSFLGNAGMQLSESSWFRNRLNGAIRRTTDNPRWGDIYTPTPYYSPSRTQSVTVHSLDAAEMLPKLFEAMRRTLAECRYPHEIRFSIKLKAEWQSREEDWRSPDEIAEARERVAREYKDRKKREEAELREREYRFRQLRQKGNKINPRDFGEIPEPPVVDTDKDDGANDDGGDDESHPWAKQYKMYGILMEVGFFASTKWVDACERILGCKMERHDK